MEEQNRILAEHLIKVVKMYYTANNELAPGAFEAAARYLESIGMATVVNKPDK